MDYPIPICQFCFKLCSVYEEVDTSAGGKFGHWELWCYCKSCELDTFHAIDHQD